MAFYADVDTERFASQSGSKIIMYGVVIFFAISVVGLVSALSFGTSSNKDTPASPMASSATGQPKAFIAGFAARADIEPGTHLSPELFEQISIPLDQTNENDGSIVMNAEELTAGYARRRIAKGMTIRHELISDHPPVNIVTSRIPDGYRAVAITVDTDSAVEGWARPGSKVDVIWTSEVRGQKIVSTIVRNAEVLSAEQSSVLTNENGDHKVTTVPRHITLMLPVADAQKVQLAKSNGKISLSLRGDDDTAASGEGTLSLDYLLRSRNTTDLSNSTSVTLDGKDFVFKDGKLQPKSEGSDD